MADNDNMFVIQSDATAQDSELEDLQRQVLDLQEDLQVKQAQDAAAREEGQRKSTGGAAAAAAVKNTSVFVGNCDPKTTEADLKLFFAGCGAIRRVTILKDRYTGAPRGNCYVEFETEEGMNSAATKDGQSCHGKALKVSIKRDAPAPGMGPRGGPQAGGISGQALQAMMRGGGGNPMMMRGGRGGPAAAVAMQQQAMMAGMMMMMGGGMPFAPFGAPRGGRGGGRGRGRPY
ncbi:RNA-binding protein, putative [Bodo saltans]|uniref:RNA-binding protein, putative n=1 Tax=Bodo saltans TaxID=75058 RepID=A0A0S4JLX4_BODSA|nr:RNA-binding protein, putative [Bodo saltans]|eukprot:CUG90269.1 RNA-binding protein, putative [Bodo saltans]